MPYRMMYEPAPKNESLVVYPELPEGAKEFSFSFITRTAYKGIIRFYFCSHCNGWIEGEPNEYQVNTLRPERLAGRSGTEYYCCRCGNEIGFMGIMS